MSFQDVFKHRLLIALPWAAIPAVGLRYYLAASTEVWQNNNGLFFNDWLSDLIFMGLFFSRAMQPTDITFKSLTLLSQTIAWFCVPFILCIEIGRLIEVCIQIFLSNPSAQTMSAVSYGGGLLLLAYLGWVLSFPMGGSSDHLGQQLYRGSYMFLLVLGLTLAVFIFRTLLGYQPSIESSPEVQMILFHHKFQRLGVLLLLLLFLRVFLPTTLIEISHVTRRANQKEEVA